jgi:hypothetical protein
MNEAAIEALKEAIAQRELEITLLKDVIGRLEQKPRLALPPPGAKHPAPRETNERKRREPVSGEGRTGRKRGPRSVMDVRGHDITVTPAERALLEALGADGVEGLLPAAAAEVMGCQGVEFRNAICRLRAKLKPAGATLILFSGIGYQLVEMEG